MTNNGAKARHLATGRYGENMAVAFVCEQGLEVLERNWRPAACMARGAASLELDIIARDGDCLVFAEVKTRRLAPGGTFNPLEVFAPAKQKKLLRAAMFYLEAHAAWVRPCRFDLICIVIDPGGIPRMEHYKNVLSFEHFGRRALGGGNAPWQPW